MLSLIYVPGNLSASNLCVPHYAKSNVPCGAIWSICRTRGVPIPETKRCVTEVRSTAHHSRRSRGRTDRIYPRCSPVPLRIEVIGTPFPHVSSNRVQTIAIGCEAIHGTRSGKAVLGQIGIR